MSDVPEPPRSRRGLSILAGLGVAAVTALGGYIYYELHQPSMLSPPPKAATPVPQPPVAAPAPAIKPPPKVAVVKPLPPPSASPFALNALVQDAVTKAEAAATLAEARAADARRAQGHAKEVAQRAEDAARQAQSPPDPQTQAMTQMMSPGAPVFGTAEGTLGSASTRWQGQVAKPYAYDVPDGFGVFTLNGGPDDGALLQREVRQNGAPTSPFAVMIWRSGARYEGEFEDRPSGAGVLTLADKTSYEGEFKAGVRNGSGVLHRDPGSNDADMAGQWVSDGFTGYGVITAKDIGGKMSGAFVKGLLNGYGAIFDSQSRVSQQGLFTAGKLTTPLKPSDH